MTTQTYRVLGLTCGEPVLLDIIGHEFTPGVAATSAQIVEADRYGTPFCASTSSAVWDVTVPATEREIIPADTLTIEAGHGRPPQTYTVQPVPSRVEGWAGQSHRELRVQEV